MPVLLCCIPSASNRLGPVNICWLNEWIFWTNEWMILSTYYVPGSIPVLWTWGLCPPASLWGRWRCHVKTLERSRQGRRDDCKDCAPVSVFICRRVGITPLVPASPLQRKLTSATSTSSGVWLSGMRWTRWTKWAMWTLTSCSALRTRAPHPALALQCGSPRGLSWWERSQFAGYKLVGLF